MAVYTKETALYDTGKIGNDINAAGQTATNYITNISGVNGISVHDTNDTSNFVNMNSEGVNVYQGGTDVASFGLTTRIGTTTDASITIDNSSIVGVGEDNKKFFNFTNSDSVINVTRSYSKSLPFDRYPTTQTTVISVDYDPSVIKVSCRAPTESSSTSMGTFTFGTAVTRTRNFTIGSTSYTINVLYDGARTFKSWADKVSSSSTDLVVISIKLTVSSTAPSYELGDGEATGGYALAEGSGTIASGNYSHAEGRSTTASSADAHAEGTSTTASGIAAHAEGNNTEASGGSSHAEGNNTHATNTYAHAEGYRTHANGSASHSQNYFTVADGDYQTAIGKYNVSDTANHVFIIGNGTSSARSNALTVDWDGDVNIASGAKYKINGTALAASDVGAVPTTRKVNNKALSADITLSASDVSAVPTTRTVNSKALSADITLSASDVSAVPTTRKVNNKALSADITLSASDVSAVPTTRKVNNKALSADITLSASDVSAVPTTRTVNSKALSADITLSASDVSAVPTTRTVNSKALSADITLSASDVSAVPTTRTVNSKSLSEDISLSASDVGAVPTVRTVNGKALSANIADADYVTDAGTSGSWTYRKWNSGKVEAWCGYSFASAASTVWASPIRYWDKTISIPSGIFSTTPRLIVSSQSNQYWVGGASASSATAGTARVLTVASGSMAVNLSIYAVSG